MGKGSKQRPTDQAKYNDGWDRIFGQKEEIEAVMNESEKTFGDKFWNDIVPTVITWLAIVLGGFFMGVGFGEVVLK